MDISFDNFANVCRACLSSKSGSIDSIFTRHSAEMFTECTSLKVSETDFLPHGLCTECNKLLKSFYDFRQLCHTSHSWFTSYISSNEISLLTQCDPSEINVLKYEEPLRKASIKLENEDSDSISNWTLQENIIADDEVVMNDDLVKAKGELNKKTSKGKLLKPIRKCPICKKTFAYLRSLKKHQDFCGKNCSASPDTKNDKPTTFLSCGLCLEQYESLEMLNYHLEVHKTNNIFVCKICEFKGIDWADFLSHRYSHQPDAKTIQIRCWACTKRFSNVESLEFHVRRVHLNKLPGLCKICHKEFMNIKNWRAHKLIHAGVKPNECKVCGKCFTYKRSLVLHMRCHSDVKKYVCHTCGIAFKFHTGLTSHQFRMHSDVQAMICYHCGKTFKNSETLREHLLRVTSTKDFECPECNKKYRSQKELENHTKWHSQLKPFQCSQCGKGYKSSNHLNNHMRQHTGERPYRCDICTSSFMTSSVLKKHKMIHSGEKPHVCQVCRKGFIEKSNLKNHLRTHKQFLEMHSSIPIF